MLLKGEDGGAADSDGAMDSAAGMDGMDGDAGSHGVAGAAAGSEKTKSAKVGFAPTDAVDAAVNELQAKLNSDLKLRRESKGR